MCSGSEADSYLRLIDFVYHSTLGLRVIKKKMMMMKRECVYCGSKAAWPPSVPFREGLAILRPHQQTIRTGGSGIGLQGYLAHKKTPNPLGHP